MSNIIRIKNRYYDLGTKNTSFLQTAQELKTIGVKNWYFFLEVKYPNLGVQDLDPYSKDLTPEQIASITLECKANPYFFFREVQKIPVRGIGLMPTDLTRMAAAMLWCFDHSIDFSICTPRQCKKTTWITSIVSYMFLFEYQNCDIPYLHLTEKRCLENANILRDYVEALPPYLNPWYGRKHPPGNKSLKYEEHGTNITIVSVADSEDAARDKLRGYTLFGGFIDEWEYLAYIGAVISGGAPAMVSARENARKLGIRCCIMFASTPGNLETSVGRDAMRIIESTPKFSEKMYDLTEEETSKMFEGMELTEANGTKTPVTKFYIEYNWKQCRKTEEWVAEQHQLAVNANDISEYRRGILLERYRGSDTSIFLQEDIDYLVAHVRQPDHEIMLLGKYILYVYDHTVQKVDIKSEYQYFDVDVPYLVGIDVAAGTGGDSTVLLIVHPYTLEIAGIVCSPYLGCNLDLIRVVATLAKMLPRAIFCPETNSVGKALIEWVAESELEYRFYHDPQLDMTKNAIAKTVDNEIRMKQKAQIKKYIGTNVTQKVRNDMMALLKRFVHDYRHMIYCKFLVRDITNLTILGGKIQADKGEHDDVVMAYCHVLYVLTYGYDLSRFGIVKERQTFEKAYQITQAYENAVKEDIVNNVVYYDNPNAYENQLLNDIIDANQRDRRMGFDQPGGVDRYGYRPEDYNKHLYATEKAEERLSYSDMEFFQSVNQFM
jgi:hypothetical protein